MKWFANKGTVSANNKRPETEQIHAISRPTGVCGVISPYPTVVMVTTAQYQPTGILSTISRPSDSAHGIPQDTARFHPARYSEQS
ncbi:hypothetical protein MAR_005827 [Mya arenaria]|uniref:Uncharacterized protein n=1 Tax=Mya arenaria TaxID=6604 RepID=A0ABY7F281_MYAAR|nr:hypothetical protein MAR_005827 [Mya arenaria]